MTADQREPDHGASEPVITPTTAFAAVSAGTDHRPPHHEHLARIRQAELVNAERHRIARDLHDSVAQCLVGIGMHLEWCHRHLDPGSPAYERLVAIGMMPPAVGPVIPFVALRSRGGRPAP